MKVVASNRKAYFNFETLKEYEAGIILEGWEVKSVKAGKVSLDGAYIRVQNGEVFLENCRISKWKYGFDREKENEERKRKLLLNKQEIRKLESEVKQSGNTIIPLEIYLSHGLVKITVALARGKKRFDKRKKIKEKDLERKIDRERREFNI